MNTNELYKAVKDNNERGAAMNLTSKIRIALEKGQTGELVFSEKVHQFGKLAEDLTRKDFPKGLEFTFFFDEDKQEVTVTVSPKKVRVLFLEDTADEEAAIENGKCDFAVVERSPEIFVSTREKISILRSLGWKTLLGEINGGIKRFRASISRKKFLEQLQSLYPGAEIIVDG